MQFQVPQFIEIEDKIFGPLTFKQFVYVVGGAGVSYVLWTILPSFIAVILIVPVLALAGALAFYKVNKKPFVHALEAGFKYALNNKLYLWKMNENKASETQASEKDAQEKSAFIPTVSKSKLEDISWSLGVKESMYAQEQTHATAGQAAQEQAGGVVDGLNNA